MPTTKIAATEQIEVKVIVKIPEFRFNGHQMIRTGEKILQGILEPGSSLGDPSCYVYIEGSPISTCTRSIYVELAEGQ